jgi:hypothetical protein
MTQLASGNIAVSTTGLDLTSISQSYKSLQLVIRNLYMGANGLGTALRFNNDSGGNYYGAQLWQSAGSSGTGAYDGASNFDIGYLNTSSSSSDGQFVILDIPDYTNTTAWKCTNLYSGGQNGNSPFALNSFNILGYYKSKTALDRITMTTGGAGFGGGTYILYGVN